MPSGNIRFSPCCKHYPMQMHQDGAVLAGMMHESGHFRAAAHVDKRLPEARRLMD